ncbi:hypothetical protein MNBD_ALPHA09-2307 [hydrothermal vent metagenome]|uniref:Uncharacterized protein n=1 Tax=hydrothermal vent metagenome TaxID=652676 RepID=A0A3B0UGZ1_9ZZZZ
MFAAVLIFAPLNLPRKIKGLVFWTGGNEILPNLSNRMGRIESML